MLNRDDRLAVALSGGKDSLALLHILKRIGSKFPKFRLSTFTIDEGIKGLFTLGLCWLDHHRLFDDGRKIDGRGMKPLVDQGFCHIDRSKTDHFCAGDQIVNAPPFVTKDEEDIEQPITASNVGQRTEDSVDP